MSLIFTQYSDKSYVVRGEMLNDNKTRKELTKNINGNCIWNTRLKEGPGLLVPINDNNTSYLEKMSKENKDKLPEEDDHKEHKNSHEETPPHTPPKEKEEPLTPPSNQQHRKVFQSPPKMSDRFRSSPVKNKRDETPPRKSLSPLSPLTPPPLEKFSDDRRSRRKYNTPSDSDRRKKTRKSNRYSDSDDSDSDRYQKKKKKSRYSESESDSDRYSRDTRRRRSKYSSSSEEDSRKRYSSSSEEDSSEDERILQTLRRKGSTKPGSKVISNDINSDEEDIITLARRIRFQDKRIKELESELERMRRR